MKIKIYFHSLKWENILMFCFVAMDTVNMDGYPKHLDKL